MVVWLGKCTTASGIYAIAVSFLIKMESELSRFARLIPEQYPTSRTHEAALIGWFESLEHWGTLWSLRVHGASGSTGYDRIPFP
jgi:hypothetical protein